MLHRFFAAAAAFAALFLVSATAPAAAADKAAESYVETNANAAIASLTERDPKARAQRFRALFNQFADFPAISNFVLGPRAAAELRANAALNKEWQDVFLEYATTVYETQLDRFRGNEMKVLGSVDRVPGKDVIVRTQITPLNSSRPMNVNWRIVRRGQEWRVVDVSLVLNGSEVWLAQQQQRDFAAILSRNQGSVRALIDAVRQQTASMRASMR